MRDEPLEIEEIFHKFLKNSGKTKVDELSIQAASNLIDELKKIKVESDGNNSELLATRKHIDFLSRL